MNFNKENFIKIRLELYKLIEADVIESLTHQELSEQLLKQVEQVARDNSLPTTSSEKQRYVTELVNELVGLGPLQELVDDKNISDIMVNGPEKVFIERNGKLELTDVRFIDEIQLQTIAKRIASMAGRRLDDSSPICDARLSDGSRVNMVLSPLTLDGTSISIRKFKEDKLNLSDLVRFGALNEDMAKFLIVASHCRLNIVISGGTGAGKTTFLNALSDYIADDERIITIEDAAELKLNKVHTLRMETRKASTEGSGEINQNKLVINALRMRPDRIIIGECRGPEAFEMLQAMNTGHDGSMTTLHANSPRDAISRIENMVMMGQASLPHLAIKRNIVDAVDIIVQVKRLSDGSRRVTSISEVVGLEGDVVVMEEYFALDLTKDLSQIDPQTSYITQPIPTRSAVKEKAGFFGIDF